MIGKILYYARVNHQETNDKFDHMEKRSYESQIKISDASSKIDDIQAKVNAMQNKVDKRFDQIQEDTRT